MKTSISAVIPVYNGEKFIQEAIESILYQTHAVDEIVIVDDGSQDASYEIASALSKTSTIDIKIVQQENSGVSAARNLGLINSSCELIAFLDVDDIWKRDKIEKQMRLYTLENDINMFTFVDYYSDIENDEARKFYLHTGINTCLDAHYSQKAFQLAFINENFVGTASGVMFNRQLALKINGFNIKLNHSEDFDFILRYSLHAKIKALNEPLVIKRHHGNNLTGNLKLHFFSHCMALNYNINLDSSYSRFNFDSIVAHQMKVSHDDYKIKYCNAVYEHSVRDGLVEYIRAFSQIYTKSGYKIFLSAFLRKLIRTLSFNSVRR